MRIAIDARFMGAGRTRGIGRYIEELVRAMLEVAPEHRYILVTPTAGHVFFGHPSVETMVADIPWYTVDEQRKMPRVLRAANADLAHIPHWNIPLAYRGPMVVTIHDLLLRHEPASAKASTKGYLTRTAKRAGYRLVLDSAIKSARRLLVPTEFVAKDVASFYPKAAKKTVVTGEGMPGLSFEESETWSAPEKPYLFYVGSAYPHKRLEHVVKIWPDVRKRYPDLHFKIAGEKDAFMERLEAFARDRRAAGIEFLGRVTDEELQELYRHASAFIYPSHFEGFGLPPLEALAAGCPVISSDAASLPEVLGEHGAIFFRDGSPDAILRAIEQVMHDPRAARGMAHAAARELSVRHAWNKAAERTIAAYEDALHRPLSWTNG